MSDPENDSDPLDFYESDGGSSDESSSSENESETEENYTGKMTLIKIVRESRKNSVTFHWKQGLPPQYYYGYLLSEHLKREPNEPYKWPLVCHKGKKRGKKNPSKKKTVSESASNPPSSPLPNPPPSPPSSPPPNPPAKTKKKAPENCLFRVQ